MVWATHSPRPVPDGLVVKNGSKIRAASWVAMPPPVSPTITSTLPSRARAWIRSRPPSGMACSALRELSERGRELTAVGDHRHGLRRDVDLGGDDTGLGA